MGTELTPRQADTFNALRRLNKPVVMLQYKGENHGLEKPANQLDYSARMREFFEAPDAPSFAAQVTVRFDGV